MERCFVKRDMELIRKMLIAIEDNSAGWAPDPLKIEGYSDEAIGYHAYLLVDAGLAKGTDMTTNMSTAPEYMIQMLTWAGHEFCQAAREDTRRKKAMGVVAKKEALSRLKC
jgi:hypothetical protein